MKVRIAYVEEPPYYWTADNKSATGADIELAEVILKAIGVTTIEHQLTSFDQLLSGVQEERWDMNVPIFVTPERSKLVAFSKPVWAIGDGFVISSGNPKALDGYKAVALRSGSRLGIIPGQIQHAAAKRAGVNENQIVLFQNQPEAVAALISGKIDAFAGTSVGSRAIADEHNELAAIALTVGTDSVTPVGAYSFSKKNEQLLSAVNGQLQKYLGSADHIQRMAKYGITRAEIDGAIAGQESAS